MKGEILKKVLIEVARRISLSTVSLFLWVSAVVGFFTGVADVVQYVRYSNGFPGVSFTMNLLAGVAAFFMCAFSVGVMVKLCKNSQGPVQSSIAVSTDMAFVLAYLPRAAIGSAVRPDLFNYLGGLGVVAIFLVSISAPPDTPDNTP